MKYSKNTQLLLKMIENKKYVRQYLRGEITLEELHTKGIKLAMPI